MTKTEVRALALTKLEESLLDGKDLATLKLECLLPPQVAALDEKFQERPGLKLPYFTPLGQPLHVHGKHFFRLRYLGKPPSAFGEEPEKQLKYVQPAESGTAAYFPRGFDWAAALQPSEPLFLTEGELKSACACKLGIPMIGLGGVFNFQSAPADLPLLPELEAIDWMNRAVNIVYDSDYETNPQIRIALTRLIHALITRGARPRVINLPTLDGAKKTGVDDFLAAAGVEAFKKLVEQATEARVAKTLWDWNDRFAFVQDPGLVVDVVTGQRMGAAKFEDEHYRHVKIFMKTEKPDGSNKFVEKCVATLWLDWAHRFEVERISYEPGRSRIYDGAYNLWRGWGVEPQRGDVRPWAAMLDHLFGKDQAARTWFERWCAYPIQHPGTKLFTAVVLWSLEHGVGKSIIGETLGRIYGAENYAAIGQDDLESAFNDYAYGKQFVFGDDVTGSDNRTYADKLKKLITQERARINEKYIPKFTIRDCVNYLFTTNQPNAFYLEKHDRRYFIWQIQAAPRSPEVGKAYHDWMSSKDGAAALRYHLEHLALGDFAPYAPAPMTLDKQSAIEQSQTDCGVWLEDLRLNGHPMLAELVTAQQLLAMYEHATGRVKLSVNGMSRELTKASFKKFREGNYLYVHGHGARYWVLRQPERWAKATVKEAQAYLEQLQVQEPKEAKY